MIVVVANEKGGTGKTTLAVNLAAMRALAGKDTLLLDTDKQESATTWAATRHEAEVKPHITCVSKRGKVGYDIAAMREKFDTIIVDAGGRDSLEMRQATTVCDILVIPMRASQFDTWSLDAMVAMLREIEEKTTVRPNAVAVVNAVSANPQVRETEEMRQILADPDYQEYFGTLDTHITDRIAFRRAAREGVGVIELAGPMADPKANLEMFRFYKEVFGEDYAAAA